MNVCELLNLSKANTEAAWDALDNWPEDVASARVRARELCLRLRNALAASEAMREQLEGNPPPKLG